MRFTMVCNLFFSFIVFTHHYDRSDPDKETQGWGENDRGVSFTFGADVVAKVC
jgi:hypothetical protein